MTNMDTRGVSQALSHHRVVLPVVRASSSNWKFTPSLFHVSVLGKFRRVPTAQHPVCGSIVTAFAIVIVIAIVTSVVIIVIAEQGTTRSARRALRPRCLRHQCQVLHRPRGRTCEFLPLSVISLCLCGCATASVSRCPDDGAQRLMA